VTSIPHPAAPQLTFGVDTHLEVLSPTPTTSSAARWPPSRSPPPRPATSSCWPGPTSWESRPSGGVEGTGSYGAALARFLTANAQVVVEVNRPDRQARRRKGKSDPLDARAAAKAVQAGEVTVLPKAGTGQVEMIRCLRVARATAMRYERQESPQGAPATAPSATWPKSLKVGLRPHGG